MDAELLSRIQFAFTASFHFIFPPLSMGLGIMLLVVSGAHLRTKDPKWRQLAFFWTKVYGLIFAIGVATGVVQEFEFGMNWADYSRFVGNVFGSLLAAEGVFAFALEGGFLGLMLFGGQSPRTEVVVLRDVHGRVRGPLQCPVDPDGELLDADARRASRSSAIRRRHGRS